MPIFDLSLDQARASVEAALTIRLSEHESSYTGVYFRFGDPGNEEIVLQNNHDSFSDEWMEEGFSSFPSILYVSWSPRTAEIQASLERIAPAFQLLRQEIFPDKRK